MASDPAAIDDVALTGAGAAVIGGEEQDDARDVFRQQLALETLAAEELLLALRSEPEPHLPLRHDPARHDGVDADPHRPQVAREGPGQAGDSGLGAQVRGHTTLADHP